MIILLQTIPTCSANPQDMGEVVGQAFHGVASGVSTVTNTARATTSQLRARQRLGMGRGSAALAGGIASAGISGTSASGAASSGRRVFNYAKGEEGGK